MYRGRIETLLVGNKVTEILKKRFFLLPLRRSDRERIFERCKGKAIYHSSPLDDRLGRG